MKLGLKPLSHDPRDLMFARYRTGAPLPKHPATFGHEGLVKKWGMLGNDRFGDCVFAGAAHETMLWNAARGVTVPFNDECVLSDYAAVTGFDPKTGANDGGTDMREAAKYRQQKGIVDANGNRHKIGAFLFISPNDLEGQKEAIWLFGAIGFGVTIKRANQDQFAKHQPWDSELFSPVEGGHYIPGVADRAMVEVVTWGAIQPVTPSFLRRQGNSCVVYLSEEMLTAGKSPEGFDLAALQADLNAL